MYSSYNKHTHSQPKEDLKYTHTCIQPSHTQMYSIIHTQKCIQSYTCIHTHSQINVFNHTTNTHIHSPKKILNTHIHVFNHHTHKCIQSYTHRNVFNHTHTYMYLIIHIHTQMYWIIHTYMYLIIHTFMVPIRSNPKPNRKNMIPNKNQNLIEGIWCLPLDCRCSQCLTGDVCNECSQTGGAPRSKTLNPQTHEWQKMTENDRKWVFILPWTWMRRAPFWQNGAIL